MTDPQTFTADPTDRPDRPVDVVPTGPLPPREHRATAPPSGPNPWLWTIVLPMIVVIAAGAVRFYQLGLPERCYFDETYYYYDARDYLDVGTETSFAVHPPVGKWIIATGVELFGVDDDDPVQQAVVTEDDDCLVQADDGEGPNPEVRAREAAESFARRVMSAVFGTGSVAVTWFIGLRLFRRRSAALLGAALLATDGLALTMSRISMLDVFLQFFVLLGVLAMLIDRDHLWEGTPVHPPLDGEPIPALPRRDRRWLWLSGLFMGLAVATKWSGLAPLGLAWAWVLASELWWRRRSTGRWLVGMGRATARGFLALVMVPVVVYLASYAGWFANVEATRKAERCGPPVVEVDEAAVPDTPAVADPPSCTGLSGATTILDGWWEEQGEIFVFHRNLQADHPYRAPAWTWALMLRPVAYYYESCPADGPADGETCDVPPGDVAEVLGMGNPAMWWAALLGYPWLLGLAIRNRSWTAATILLFLFGQALPYLVSPRPVFLFYLTPVVPFIALSLARLADEAMDSATMRWVPATLAVVTMAGFAFWAPIFLGLEIPRSVWDLLILFDSWV